MELSLPALLAYVEECDVSDAEDLQLLQPKADTRSRSFTSSTSSFASERRTKYRPRRDTVDIAALRSHVADLALELNKLQAVRGRNALALCPPSSYWQIETQRQSRLRTAAQEENERLRAQMHVQKQIAKRLANLLRRNSFSQMLRIVQRYELDAKLRADRALTRLDEDLDLAFLQTDAVLMKAEMYTLPPVFSDARIHRQNYSEGLLVEYRRNLWVPHDRDATIDASWDFIPHQCPSKSMNFDHDVSTLSDSMNSDFFYHGRKGRFALRRFVTEDRAVYVWRTLLQSAPGDTSTKLRVHGRGWFVIQSATTDDKSAPSSTRVQTFARYEMHANLEQMQQNGELRLLVEYLTNLMENFGAFPAHMALSYSGASKNSSVQSKSILN